MRWMSVNLGRLQTLRNALAHLFPAHLNRVELSSSNPLQTVSPRRIVEMSALPSNIEVLVRKIASTEGLVDFDIIVGSGTNKTDNFMAELLGVIVSGKQIAENGMKIDKKLNLICKFAPVRSLRKGLQIELLFKREIFFYKNVAPAFNRFQELRKLPRQIQFASFPKCYDAVYDPANDICAIVMQDLRPDGFEMWSKEKPTPFDSLRLIFEELAKFHAVSFAMKDQWPEQFAEYTCLDDLVRVFLGVGHFETVFRQSIQRAINALYAEDHKNIMRACLLNYDDLYKNCLNGKFSDESCVVSHGDCWKNNAIYRSAPNSDVQDVFLLDYQLMRYSSPATDLMYCIFTSTDKATRDKEFDNLLRIYYERLATNIRKLGSDPTVLYSYEQLQKDLPLCGEFLLVTLPMMIQLSFVEARDASDLDDTFDVCVRGAVRTDLLVGLTANGQVAYRQRINECFEDLDTLGCFAEFKK